MGAAYLFDVTTGNEIFSLMVDDPAASDEFGFSVSISGNRAIVGSRSDDGGGSASGSAYLFDVTTGDQLTKLAADDDMAADRFGTSVSITSGIAIVGSPFDDDAGTSSGSAYMFE
jgi:hypothetical protein